MASSSEHAVDAAGPPRPARIEPGGAPYCPGRWFAMCSPQRGRSAARTRTFGFYTAMALNVEAGRTALVGRDEVHECVRSAHARARTIGAACHGFVYQQWSVWWAVVCCIARATCVTAVAFLSGSLCLSYRHTLCAPPVRPPARPAGAPRCAHAQHQSWACCPQC